MDNTQITVTSPLLPDLDELDAYLRDIWSRKWITNNGHYHKELEAALCEYLKVPYWRPPCASTLRFPSSASSPTARCR